MNGRGKSDGPIVPAKPSNNGRDASRRAERVEGRGPTKGNPVRQTRFRAQNRADLQHALDRIRQAVKRNSNGRLTTLWHHVYAKDRLRQAFQNLNRKASPGVDGVTWQQYAENLEVNLEDLSERLRRGSYRARPVRRVYIPKADGRQRPLGVASLEDKIVQRATTEVLNAIYEVDFLGFSYGFRPNRGQHNALDALTVGLQKKKVNWVIDADISGFFDAIDRKWLTRFLEHRIADRCVLRHVHKWLEAGVLEGGKKRREETGTAQGGSISPLLANVYLHYVFDLWVQQWRNRHAQGDVIVVRFADDIVLGFERRDEAERFLEELGERFRKFNLKLHPAKTRLLEFGRYAAERRHRRGQGKPETFDFLGLTHICGRDRGGRFVVLRKTRRRRVRAKLRELKVELRRRLHLSIPDVGRWLASVLRGHYRYYGVPRNYRALATMRYRVIWLWYRALRRRSQRHKMTWERIRRLEMKWLPQPRIYHPHPQQRLRV